MVDYSLYGLLTALSGGLGSSVSLTISSVIARIAINNPTSNGKSIKERSVSDIVGGALPFTVLSVYGCGRSPGRLPLNLYNPGIATLTVGSVMHGVLEIYGTTNDMLQTYWFVGFELAGIGLPRHLPLFPVQKAAKKS